jgi:uncharacterized protein YfaP (DUF2135 family)
MLVDLQLIRQAALRAGAALPPIPAALVSETQVGLRVVLTATKSGVNIDLWVAEPGDTTVYSGRPVSAGGGLLTVDGGDHQHHEEYLRLKPGAGLYTLYAYFAGRAPSAPFEPVTVFVDVYRDAGSEKETVHQAVVRLGDIEDLAKILELTY